LEGECTACPDAQFKIKYDKRQDWGGFHVPDHDANSAILQRQFEAHLKLVHPDDEARRKELSQQ
jgi:hypothetical protein